MTPIEIFALVISLLAAIKILVILVKPAAWLEVVKKVYAIPILTTIVALILAALALNYLLAELTIVQIFAVMFLMCMLTLVGAVGYAKPLVEVAKKLFKDKNLVKKSWLAIIIWILLLIWVFYVLFA